MTLEVGDVIIRRDGRRLTVVAMTGDPDRVWVCPRLTAGLVRGNAQIIAVDQDAKIIPLPTKAIKPPLCECGCGERVATQTNGVWSRWRPGHYQRRQGPLRVAILRGKGDPA